MPSIFPVIENSESSPDFAGHALSEHLEELDELAEQLGITTLSEFVYVDPGIFEDLGMDEFPEQEEWYSAADGLKTIKTLLAKLPESLADEALSEDLDSLQEILAAASESGARWHLEHDI